MDRKLNQETYEKLKHDILIFELKPGDHVSAAKLAERYHVSRTPAREALVRLEAEGIIDIYPQSKSVVSKINVHRVWQEWFIRRTLEMGMADRFIENVTVQDIELMKSYNREIAWIIEHPESPDAAYQYLSCDNDFHAVSYMVTGERLSAKIIGTMMTHYNRLRTLIDFDALTQKRTLSDHVQIIDCAERRDKKEFKDILEHHLGHIVKDIDIVRQKYPDYFEE